MGNSFNVREARRFSKGEMVWVSPSVSGHWLCDDEATVIEDLDTGYLVLQASERVPSAGLGHFVCDRELSVLHDKRVYVPLPVQQVYRERRLWEFNVRSLELLADVRCDHGGHTPRLVRTHA